VKNGDVAGAYYREGIHPRCVKVLWDRKPFAMRVAFGMGSMGLYLKIVFMNIEIVPLKAHKE
jgi:hypothetical protein